MIAKTLREEILFHLNLLLLLKNLLLLDLMRFKLRAGAGGSGPFGRYWRDLLVLLLLLVRLLLASGVVVESAVFSSAEEIVSGRVGAG